MGMVLRNHDGEVVRTACQQVTQCWDVNVVEAKAMVLGLKMAIQCGINNIILESDCQQVTNLVNGKQKDASFLGVVREIISIACFFYSVNFVHVFTF